MITIILTTVLFGFFTFKNRIKNFRKDDIFPIFFMSFIGFGIGLIISTFISVPLKKQFVKVNESKIFNLSDNFSTSGSFILGSGTIKETSYYMFYRNSKCNENAMVLDKVETEKTEIFLIDTNEHFPRIEYNEAQYASESYLNYFALPECILRIKQTYSIYVPKNSIIRNYMLDAKD
jgi:hypothetical protein